MYTYQPLPAIAQHGPTPPYTRVLYLDPGNGDDEPFCGRLDVVNVESAPPFEALSYTWGAPGPTGYIWIDGNPLPLGANLENALASLRLRNEVRCLWIDALCIDQSNMEERSRQVQYMRLVYQHCSRVVVWLGSKTGGADLAFQTARSLIDISNLMQEAGEQSVNNPGERINEEIINDMIDNTLSGLPSGSLHCLNDLFNREYFCRSWVVQEIIAGPKPLAKCDELEMSFLDLVSILFFIGKRRQEINMGPHLHVWYDIYSATQPGSVIRMTDIKGSLGPIVDVLEQMRDFKATDPRDKVYAVIGVCDEGIHPILSLTHNYVNSHSPSLQAGIPDALIPDYNKDVATVYIDLARYLIKKAPMTLDVLSYIQHVKEPEPSSECPSWVPKWFEPRTYQKFRGMGNYQAGFCKTPVLSGLFQSQTLRALAHPRHLVLEGFQVGIVDKVSDALLFGSSGEEKIGAIMGAWLQLFSFPMVPRPGYSYRAGGPLDVAFCKAITAGPTGMRFGALLTEAS
ncbi:unnamed protein product [Clonostachys rosea]|uniref:Heterokaryon incompatibility domain-containing protein n=1 Tax=Bionectria ochroleuca TaxID=29856 RepID=A0ABY6UEN5_BIOOC|nr:unnamed protein product [Clonostachys rosea]